MNCEFNEKRLVNGMNDFFYEIFVYEFILSIFVPRT